MAKVSLVLGGGGARGAAHVGVIQALQEGGLLPEVVVGVSIGALVGAVFCAFPFPEATERLEAASKKIKDEVLKEKSSSPYFQTRRLFSESRIRALLENDLGLVGMRFYDLHTPLFVRAVTLPEFKRVEIGGKEDRSDVVDAALASCAQWPYSWNGKLFLDGGISGSLPVRIAQEKGSDCIFAVNLGYLFKRDSGWKEYLPWKIIDYLGKQMVSRELETTRSTGARIYEIYSPRVETFSVYDFSSPEALQREGYETCRRILEEWEG
jgi:NTE family protein